MTTQRRIHFTLTLSQAITAAQAIHEGSLSAANGLGEPMPDAYKDTPKSTKAERAVNAQRRADHTAHQRHQRQRWSAERKVLRILMNAIRETVPELNEEPEAPPPTQQERPNTDGRNQ